MSYSEINHETIHAAVKPLGKQSYEHAELHLRYGKELDDGFIDGMAKMPDATGDSITSFRPDHGMTSIDLRGSVRKLAAHTLIKHESFVLPAIIRPQNVEKLMYNQPVDKEFYGALTLTEPKHSSARIHKITHYFMRLNPALLVPVIDDGLDSYLNAGLMVGNEVMEFKEKLQEVQKHITVIHNMESDTVKNFIDSLEFNEHM